MSRPKKLIALSFDDGPADRTDDVLALLAEYDAVATFFVLGRQVEGRESIVKRVADAGHELGNHTFSHPDLEALETTLIEYELVRTSDAIDQAVGVRPCLMRPPYGRGIRRAAPVATQLGMTTVLWSVDPRDWEGSPQRISDAIVAGARPGAVVLLHDGAADGGDRSATVDAVASAVPSLASQGYSFVTVSALLAQALSIPRGLVPRERRPVSAVAHDGGPAAATRSGRKHGLER